MSVCLKEQSSRSEIGDLERQLRSSEAVVADLKKTPQQRDSELETLRSKVGPPRAELLPPKSQCMNTASCIYSSDCYSTLHECVCMCGWMCGGVVICLGRHLCLHSSQTCIPDSDS